MGYQPSLDGLRAVAVIGVILYHAGFGWMHGGFLGVEVFFVVSGFLITTLLIEERERAWLSPYACPAASSQGREQALADDPLRTWHVARPLPRDCPAIRPQRTTGAHPSHGHTIPTSTAAASGSGERAIARTARFA